MKVFIKTVVYCAFILSVGSLFAQAGTTVKVGLTWTASTNSTATTPGTTNIYKLTGNCPATAPVTTSGFTQIATGQPAGGPYSDVVTETTSTSTVCYIITAVIGGLESSPSNTFQAAIPAIPPQKPAPPTGLKGTVTQQ